MNIYLLDINPEKCAKSYADSDLRDVLDSVFHCLNKIKVPPDVLEDDFTVHCDWANWTYESRANYIWMFHLAKWLIREIEYREHNPATKFLEKHKACNRVPVGIKYTETTSQFPHTHNLTAEHPNREAEHRRVYRALGRRAIWLRGRDMPGWWFDPFYWYLTYGRYSEARKAHNFETPEAKARRTNV